MPQRNSEYWSRAGNVRHIALAWLRGEDDYQFRKFSPEASYAALDEGIRDSIWGSELGNYPLRAATTHEAGLSMPTLQAAGKSAAVARALYAVILQLHSPDMTIQEASQYTLHELETIVPDAAEADDYDYAGRRNIRNSPLWQRVILLDETLPRPVAVSTIEEEHVARARAICLAGADLFIDYAVDITPYGVDVDWPQPGLPSGELVPWRPVAD
jgi:hypothetical protein